MDFCSKLCLANSAKCCMTSRTILKSHALFISNVFEGVNGNWSTRHLHKHHYKYRTERYPWYPWILAMGYMLYWFSIQTIIYHINQDGGCELLCIFESRACTPRIISYFSDYFFIPSNAEMERPWKDHVSNEEIFERIRQTSLINILSETKMVNMAWLRRTHVFHMLALPITSLGTNRAPLLGQATHALEGRSRKGSTGDRHLLWGGSDHAGSTRQKMLAILHVGTIWACPTTAIMMVNAEEKSKTPDEHTQQLFCCHNLKSYLLTSNYFAIITDFDKKMLCALPPYDLVSTEHLSLLSCGCAQ